MNVLVYAGPEVLKNSLGNTVSLLKNVLNNYSIQQITLPMLKSEPWHTNCSLFVLPQCRTDLPSTAFKTVSSYVENGGKFIAYGIGTRISSDGSGNAFLNRDTGQRTALVFDNTNKQDASSVSVNVGQGVAVMLGVTEIDNLKKALENVGLLIGTRSVPDHPVPLFLVSNMPSLIQKIRNALDESFTDAHDSFMFHELQDAEQVLKETPSSITHIIACPDGIAPAPALTSRFNLEKYLSVLKSQMGSITLYGEVVGSTQTMLDKNPLFQAALPAPFVSVASHQLSGRGRGSNVWVSPEGCLQFSLLLRVSTREVPSSKLVFIQYLFSLAVSEACRDKSVMGVLGKRVRIKWPNDIYLETMTGERKKIGGILVNISFQGDQVSVIIGCGLNVLNSAPIASLVQLFGGDHNTLAMEDTLAAILEKFDGMWTLFVEARGSFDEFMDLYLERWLHSDQLVTLETTIPPTRVRISGITREHGLLRTIPEREGGFIDLQPDGNSFDVMAGLIKSKNT